MKEKLLRGVAIATVSIISAALVAYLKNPENRVYLQKSAKKYQSQLKKSARKARVSVNRKIREIRI